MTDDLTAWLTERREKHDAATDGAWAIWEDLTEGGFVHVGDEAGVIPEGQMTTSEDGPFNPTAKCYVRPDAEFIVDAKVTLPRLLAAVEAVVELHKPFEAMDGGRWVKLCPSCRNLYGAMVPWPCVEVRAIRAALLEGDE